MFIRYFQPDETHYGELDCEENSEFWADGSAKPGTKCSVTCQDGYKLAEGKISSMTCIDDWDWGYDWYVFIFQF